MKMKLYFVAYKYNDQVEFLEGPFGTFSEAFDCKYGMIRDYEDDADLVIVSRMETVDVE